VTVVALLADVIAQSNITGLYGVEGRPRRIAGFEYIAIAPPIARSRTDQRRAFASTSTAGRASTVLDRIEPRVRCVAEFQTILNATILVRYAKPAIGQRSGLAKCRGAAIGAFDGNEIRAAGLA
jgi:hypothetical protein